MPLQHSGMKYPGTLKSDASHTGRLDAVLKSKLGQPLKDHPKW